jgi:hypothetical protein
VTRHPVRARAPSRRPRAAGSWPAPPGRLRAISDRFAAPDQGEEPDATAGGELGQLGRGAVGGAREDRLDGGRQRPEEVRERALVLEGEHTRPHVSLRFARSWCRQSAVCGRRTPHFQAGQRERDAVARRQRQPQRIGLDAPAGQPLGPDRESHHAACHRHRVQAAVARQAIHDGARPGKQMRAVVHPVVAAGIGTQAAAEPLVGLKQQDVVLTQPPRRSQPGDAAADHDHVPELAAHRCHGGQHRPP